MHDRIHVALRAVGLEYPDAQGDIVDYQIRRYRLQLQLLADGR